MLADPALSHVCFDISWDEVAKYAMASADVSARAKIRRGNYERLFDAARRGVRAWEQSNKEGTTQKAEGKGREETS